MDRFSDDLVLDSEDPSYLLPIWSSPSGADPPATLQSLSLFAPNDFSTATESNQIHELTNHVKLRAQSHSKGSSRDQGQQMHNMAQDKTPSVCDSCRMKGVAVSQVLIQFLTR
jgi:hypothetical protein